MLSFILVLISMMMVPGSAGISPHAKDVAEEAKPDVQERISSFLQWANIVMTALSRKQVKEAVDRAELQIGVNEFRAAVDSENGEEILKKLYALLRSTSQEICIDKIKGAISKYCQEKNMPIVEAAFMVVNIALEKTLDELIKTGDVKVLREAWDEAKKVYHKIPQIKYDYDDGLGIVKGFGYSR